MSDSVTVSFEGLDELKKVFEMLPKRVALRAASQAVRAGAKPILEAARAKCPVDTGNLKASLAIKILNQKRDAMDVVALIGPQTKYRRIKRADKILKGRQKYNVKLDEKGGDGFYGFFIEKGTRFYPAHPFLRPAYDENKVKAQQIIIDTVGDAIMAEMQKATVK